MAAAKNSLATEAMPSQYADLTEQAFAFELLQFAGIDLNAFDNFMATRRDIWASRRTHVKDCRRELLQLRHDALCAYRVNNFELSMAHGRAMRWLAEYVNYRWSVHDVAHKGNIITSRHARNRTSANAAREARANKELLDEFTRWQQLMRSQLVRNGEPLTPDECVKKFKIAKRPLGDRKTRRLNKLLKAELIPPV